MDLTLREEAPADVAAIHRLNRESFESGAEAGLVDALREAGQLVLSLVAEVEGYIVGHIAFSPVTVTTSEGEVHVGLGLGPMAVASRHRGAGIGGRLIAEGLRRLRVSGHRFCVVLGHAEYYPRHGFVRASSRGIHWEKPVPDEVFFVQELVPGGLDGVSGVVRYRAEFDSV